MRLLAQRVPVTWPELKRPPRRSALLFGIAGFLPSDTRVGNDPEAVHPVLRPLWDEWWKERDRLSYAILPRHVWNLAGLRPHNRPERRIAALAALYPRLPQLERALAQGQSETFCRLLTTIEDPFWSRHTTWRSRPSPLPTQLIGTERTDDILINLFWPMVSLQDEPFAYENLRRLTSPPNRLTRIARERVLGPLSIGKALSEALVQQGLLQVYQDFCLNDATGCEKCPFPEVVRKF
jgi:hypothetical protein